MVLYRPVGAQERLLIAESGYTAFPPRYQVQTVGRSYHQEYWVPAEELEEFNRHILGRIEVIREVGRE